MDEHLTAVTLLFVERALFDEKAMELAFGKWRPTDDEAAAAAMVAAVLEEEDLLSADAVALRNEPLWATGRLPSLENLF